MKKCIKCNVEKEFTEFSKAKQNKDGYVGTCKICESELKKQYRLNNLENIKIKKSKYWKLNSEYFKKINKIYYNNNRKKQIEYQKQYQKNNLEKILLHRKERKLINPLFKLRCNLSSLIGGAIRRQGYPKKSKTHKILGCSFIEFKQHLEAQFTKGMNWDNQGEWHLDHIYPVSLAKDEEELIRLNHYTNFQPLWAIENFKKGNKIINKQLTLI